MFIDFKIALAKYKIILKSITSKIGGSKVNQKIFT